MFEAPARVRSFRRCSALPSVMHAMHVMHVMHALLAILAFTSAISAQVRQWDMLPPEMRSALERNAASVNPISFTFIRTSQPNFAPQETIEIVRFNGQPEDFFKSWRTNIIWQDRNVFTEQFDLSGDQGRFRTSFNGFGRYSIEDVEPPYHLSLLRSRPPRVSNVYGSFGSSYLPAVGITVTGDAYRPIVQPSIRTLLETSAELHSIHAVPHGGRMLAVVSLITPNEDQVSAHRANLTDVEAQLRRGINTEEQIQQMLRNIRLRRELPELVQIQFTLDPERHYAVRRIQETYLDGRILKRIENSEFEYIPSRDIWLPRRIRTDLHKFSTVPGEVFEEAPISHILQVEGDFGLDRVPDETFTLNDVEAGMWVYDDLSGPQQVQIKVQPGMEEQMRAFLAADPARLPPGITPGTPPAPASADSEDPEASDSTRTQAAEAPAVIPATTEPVAQTRERRMLGNFVAVLIIAVVVILTVRFVRRMK